MGVTCPQCNGTKQLLNPSNSKFIVCYICNGSGSLAPDEICACGRHATVQVKSTKNPEKVYLTCGRDSCLRDKEYDAFYDRFYRSNSWDYRANDYID